MTHCIHRILDSAHSQWQARLMAKLTWLTHTEIGIYGTPATEDDCADTQHWEHVV
jgi:hypothetical protein